MENKKKLAVIILNWNGKALLEKFIPTASRFTVSEEADLIVADNGSTDGSLSWLRENHPEVGIIALEENHGFSKGYNIAIDRTRYKYTVLLNSDVEVTEDWWKPLLDFMERHEEAAAVQPKIRAFNDKEKFEYAGAAGGYLDRLGYSYCRGRIFDRIETDNGQYDNGPEEVCWASGAALMVRTEVYLKLGGLDELFFAHMEEIDLCCRMHAAGYKVYCVPASVVYHVGGASLPQGNPKKTYLNFRNNLLLLHKNLPEKKGKKVLLLRRLADTLAFGMFLLKGDFGDAGAVLKAHKDFRKMKKLYRDFPAEDFLYRLPGADRYIVRERYLGF